MDRAVAEPAPCVETEDPEVRDEAVDREEESVVELEVGEPLCRQQPGLPSFRLYNLHTRDNTVQKRARASQTTSSQREALIEHVDSDAC